MSGPYVQIEKVGASGYFTLRLVIDQDIPFKYWQGFLDELKEMIPSCDREYDPKTQVWTIRNEHYGAVVELRRKHFEKDQINLFG